MPGPILNLLPGIEESVLPYPTRDTRIIMRNCATFQKRMTNQDTRGWTAVCGWHIRTATLQFN
jgi:hypothetical protein